MGMLSNYLQHRIRQLGIRGRHGDVKVYYSLNSCQGDGVSFEHEKGDSLPAATLRDIVNRRCRGEGELRLRLLRLIHEDQFSISIRQSDSHYVHAYTMHVDAETGGMENDEDAVAIDGLAEILKEEIVSISKTVEHEGYEIGFCHRFESETVREFKTSRFLLRIEHLPAEEHELDFELETVEDMADGLVEEIFNLKVTLLELDEDGFEDGEVADEVIGGFIRYKGQSNRTAYSGYLKQMVAEVCETVRPRKKRTPTIDLAAAA